MLVEGLSLESSAINILKHLWSEDLSYEGELGNWTLHPWPIVICALVGAMQVYSKTTQKYVTSIENGQRSFPQINDL